MAASILLRVGSGYENAGWSWLIPGRVYFTARLEDDITHAPIQGAAGVRFYVQFDIFDGRAPLIIEAAESEAAGEWTGYLDLTRGQSLQVQAISGAPALQTGMRTILLRTGPAPAPSPREAIVLRDGQIVATDEVQYLSGQRVSEAPEAGGVQAGDIVGLFRDGLLTNLPADALRTYAEGTAAAAGRDAGAEAAGPAAEEKVEEILPTLVPPIATAAVAPAVAAADGSRVQAQDAAALATSKAVQTSNDRAATDASKTTAVAAATSTQAAIANAAPRFRLKADADAAIGTIPADGIAVVFGELPASGLNGQYIKTGGILVREADTLASLNKRFSLRQTPMISGLVDVEGRPLVGATKDTLLAQTPAGFMRFPSPMLINPYEDDGWPQSYGSATPYNGAVVTAAMLHILNDPQILWVLIWIGQSLAGMANDNPDDQVLNSTSTYPANNLMPSVGQKTDGQDFDDLVPCVEVPGTGFDTNRSGMITATVNAILEACQTQLGFMPTIASFIASRGARTWDQIGPGNEAWEALTKGMSGVKRGAMKRQMRPQLLAGVYYQGEQDRGSGLSRTRITRNRQNMARNLQDAARAVWHQTFTAPVFISQPGNSVSTNGLKPDHMLGPLEADGLDNIRLLGPNYQYQMSAPTPPPPPASQPSGVHHSSLGYDTMAKTNVAPAIMKEALGGGFFSLKMTRAEWIGPKKIRLYYSVPTPPIVVDLTDAIVRRPAWGLGGFQVFNESLAEFKVVALTAMNDPDIQDGMVRIIDVDLETVPTGYSLWLHYATRNDANTNPPGYIDPATGSVYKNAGPLTGARGCIRDSSPLPLFANSQTVHLGRAPN